MTALPYIITFCLGVIIGMFYTFVASRLLKDKHRKRDKP